MAKDKRRSNIKEVQSQINNIKTEVKGGTFIFTNKMPLGEFATKIGMNINSLIKYFLMKGKMYQINHILEEEEIAEVCLEQGLDFKKEDSIDASNYLNMVHFDDPEDELSPKPPVVTIMGHVNHGKTTLVDYIRKTKVAATETSGITQHVSAYQIKHQDKYITLIDTPGHEVFTQMRSRGAKITDIVVLVVAADDGVMPQTREAIEHANLAKASIIVFVNKMDKPQKNLEKLKSQLLEAGVVLEEYGGDVPVIYGSAINGQGVDELLANIGVLAELLDLKANNNRHASGVVVDSRSDKGAGVVTLLIIKNGTLLKGDFIVAGSSYGRVKSMLNSSTRRPIEEAFPGMPVIIHGLNTSPLAGDRFICFEDEKFAKKIALEKANIDKTRELSNRSTNNNKDEGRKILNIIVRADVQGTAEAIRGGIDGKSNNDAIIKVIGAQTGMVNNQDLLLAQASDAVIISFRMKPTPNIKQSAKQSGIRIAYYESVFEVIADIEKMLDGEKTIVYEERKTGSAHIVKLFFYSKVGTIAGCIVDEGVVKANAKVKVFRNRKLIYEGVIDSLKRGLDDAKEVDKGNDFGTHIKKFNDLKEDDILEFFEDVPVTI
ncbi:translation initiation factor IF-2 [Mycoplasmopsis opalescens]|uniref:translation initiation factor IF-2 n=1 Tax=Mycoplasmopsis opalescens TaxID=114886 RepID=UPI0004A77C8C|nr:translation initiation factor IF-2 [Mycoplasmopsis opalescens]